MQQPLFLCANIDKEGVLFYNIYCRKKQKTFNVNSETDFILINISNECGGIHK